MKDLSASCEGSMCEGQQRGAIHLIKSLAKRQTQILAIPTTYAGLNSGPPPGTVAGIVLGSVAGFLLILWLIYTCTQLGGGFVPFSSFGGYGRREEFVEEEVIIEERIQRRNERPLGRRSVRAGQAGGVSKMRWRQSVQDADRI